MFCVFPGYSFPQNCTIDYYTITLFTFISMQTLWHNKMLDTNTVRATAKKLDFQKFRSCSLPAPQQQVVILFKCKSSIRESPSYLTWRTRYCTACWPRFYWDHLL